ncbi:MAG: SDR family NAD(P)-dependent oxidoreductase [Pseudoxanthomonas sp.]
MNKGLRVALVTGAARGIGLCIASRLAQDGYKVVLVDKLDAVHNSAGSLCERGLEAAAITSEVGDVSSVEHVVEFATKTFGSVDVLINNAGFDARGANGLKIKTTETSLAAWNDVIRVNLTAPFLFCKACLPGMRSRGWGRIVNMASSVGRPGYVPGRTSTAYTASKAGLIGFSRILAGEVGNSAITVNCVAPGLIATPATSVFGAQLQDTYAAAVPLGRLGQPDDVASVVSFLASEGASFITGSSFDVNGGVYMN